MATTGSKLLRAARRLAGALPLLVLLALGLLVVIPAALGYQRYVIVSGSMTGTYDRGSIVFDRVVPTSTLSVGDVVTFRPPGEPGLVTHRIHSISKVRGVRVFSTKGDFNKVPDVWNPFALKAPMQAKVAFHVPYAGFAIAALSDRRWRMLVIGVPAALIAMLTLRALWRDSSEQDSVASTREAT